MSDHFADTTLADFAARLADKVPSPGGGAVAAVTLAHGAALGAHLQPAAGSQLSSVQALPSLQSVLPPGTHWPATQSGAATQASPLPQVGEPATGANTQPLPVSHVSAVQGLPSSQPGLLPATQAPPLQPPRP